MENLILEKPQDAQMVIVNDIFKIIRTKKDGTTSVKKQAIRNMDSDQKSGHLNHYGNIITEKSLFMSYIESKTDTIHEMIEGIETDDRYNRWLLGNLLHLLANFLRFSSEGAERVTLQRGFFDKLAIMVKHYHDKGIIQINVWKVINAVMTSATQETKTAMLSTLEPIFCELADGGLRGEWFVTFRYLMSHNFEAPASLAELFSKY